MFARGGGGGRLSWAFCMVVRLGWESGIDSLGFRDFRLCGTTVFDLDSFPYLGLTSLVNSS